MVATEFSDGFGHTVPFAMTAEDVAKGSLTGLRLGETICVPGLEDPDAAVVELRRAVEELGLKGVLHNDHVRGHYLDEPRFRPVWAELERLGV